LTLPFEDQEEITVPEPTKEKIAYERVKKKNAGRNVLPENIPLALGRKNFLFAGSHEGGKENLHYYLFCFLQGFRCQSLSM
jgi:hypothetical protein